MKTLTYLHLKIVKEKRVQSLKSQYFAWYSLKHRLKSEFHLDKLSLLHKKGKALLLKLQKNLIIENHYIAFK